MTDIDPSVESPLALAIKAAGGVSTLAAHLGLTQAAVSNWRARGQVPAEWVLKIEAHTGVSRYALRPDVFGDAPPADELDSAA